jgi:4-alpha-glucanotransferase
MVFERTSGIILHPTSLPGPDGIGDLGPEAFRWVDFLAETGCGLWQVLPLGPTGYGDSPYQCFSAFAGNPYLVSPALLLDERLLSLDDLKDRPEFPADRVDFGPVIEWKKTILHRSYIKFSSAPLPTIHKDLIQFQQDNISWLPDYALFSALKDKNNGRPWVEWAAPLRTRQQKELDDFRKENQDLIDEIMYYQFLFFRQWDRLKSYANSRNIKIVGDIPLFISHDSSDAWATPELFTLAADGYPTVVAGVPPDYFSPTGQLWGNPLYKWDIHKETGYAWWIDRISSCLKMVDILRLDHFRGFAGYWEVPANMKTAEIGIWKHGPGADLFKAIKASLGSLPIIAEDLGKITPDVVSLRDHFDLPGMRILQFAFSDDDTNIFLPHNYNRNTVAYTGSHDNDTTTGWFIAAPEQEKQFCLEYLGKESNDNIAWDMIRGIWSSVANFAIAPIQDFLRLDTNARMNYPGRQSGNWSWRVDMHYPDGSLAKRIHLMNEIYSRLNHASKVK